MWCFIHLMLLCSARASDVCLCAALLLLPSLPGLVGPLAIYAKGKLSDPGVDREIPLLFNIQNEMQSVYFEVRHTAASQVVLQQV